MPAKVLYQIVCKHCNRYGQLNNGWANRSTAELQHDTGMSRNTIIKARQDLVKTHLIEVKVHNDWIRHKSTQYRLVKYQELSKLVQDMNQ